MVEIIEQSTTEILGACVFGNNNTATTGLHPDGYQLWCERSLDASTGAATIKISSSQANLPWIHAYIHSATTTLPMWHLYAAPSGGLNAGGAVYADPYQEKGFEFAGFKKLTFTTKASKDYLWAKDHTVQPLTTAGYSARMFRFTATSPSGFIAEVDVYNTLDGRVLMEDNIIKPSWKVRSGSDATQGNRGAYDYFPRLNISATPIFASFVRLSVAQTSQTLPIGNCRHYLLELQYPGEAVMVWDQNNPAEGMDYGYCTMQHRMWLLGPQ